LSIIARKYLEIPAISASSERFLSQGAEVITKKRNRLSKTNFKKILCLKSWGVAEREEEKKKEDNNIEEIPFDFVITHQ
jgi:hypothetical protein